MTDWKPYFDRVEITREDYRKGKRLLLVLFALLSLAFFYHHGFAIVVLLSVTVLQLFVCKERREKMQLAEARIPKNTPRINVRNGHHSIPRSWP